MAGGGSRDDVQVDRCGHNHGAARKVAAPPPHQSWRKLLRILDRLGCFSFLRALASIWRMRSRVTENCWPTSSSVGEQLLLSQPPPRRLLLLLVPDRTGLALFDLPDAQTFELPAPGAPLSPSCHLASHLLGLPVPQKLFSGQLAAVGRGPAALRRIR